MRRSPGKMPMLEKGPPGSVDSISSARCSGPGDTDFGSAVKLPRKPKVGKRSSSERVA